MAFTWAALALLVSNVLHFAIAQCPNEVALYNPNARTQSSNGTWFVVPVPATAVQTALDGIYGPGNVLLAPVPTNDTTLFPTGFPSGAHPVLVSSIYTDDIRMAAFQIDGPLLASQVYATYVRKSNSQPGTILQAEITGYLVGENNNVVAGLVPATVSTLIEGYLTRLGQFVPADAAYEVDADNVISNKVAWALLPNPISGPGVYLEALDLQYTAVPAFSQYTAKLFKVLLNQPSILGSINTLLGLCQRQQYYFNNATGVISPRAGNATLGPAADGLGPQATGILQKASPGGYGIYTGLEGFSACGQTVGNNPETCDEAAKNVDPASL